MKRVRLIVLAILAIVLCGCSTARYSTSSARFYPGKSTYITNYRIMRTISPHLALAVDNRPVDNKLVIAVRTSPGSGPLYDGQIISGRFVMVDTYTYTEGFGRRNRITVPLVVPRADYRRYRSASYGYQGL
ncbi:MAG: hypothetical protein K5910_07880 [Bacteroidales bacterium]|nr:hypothetical protein [Bacteroidales bacterium]